MTKPECLTAQAKSMVLMTRILEGSSEVEKNLLVAKHRVSHPKAANIEISIIKQVVEMGVIMAKEGRNKATNLWDMK